MCPVKQILHVSALPRIISQSPKSFDFWQIPMRSSIITRPIPVVAAAAAAPGTRRRPLISRCRLSAGKNFLCRGASSSATPTLPHACRSKATLTSSSHVGVSRRSHKPRTVCTAAITDFVELRTRGSVWNSSMKGALAHKRCRPISYAMSTEQAIIIGWPTELRSRRETQKMCRQFVYCSCTVRRFTRGWWNACVLERTGPAGGKAEEPRT